eukprot:5348041-Pleurochrysis_carterae.AAC.1
MTDCVRAAWARGRHRGAESARKTDCVKGRNCGAGNARQLSTQDPVPALLRINRHSCAGCCMIEATANPANERPDRDLRVAT